MKYAYRCARCHEWAFVSDTDKRAAGILGTDYLASLLCLANWPRSAWSVATKSSRSKSVPRDERCTEARHYLRLQVRGQSRFGAPSRSPGCWVS